MKKDNVKFVIINKTNEYNSITYGRFRFFDSIRFLRGTSASLAKKHVLIKITKSLKSRRKTNCWR